MGEILSSQTRLAILAAPGGGKTTLIRRLAIAYAFPDRRTLVDDNLPDRPWLPLFIRCRQLRALVTAPIHEILAGIASRAEMEELKDAFIRLVNRALCAGEALLLVDGLDEISDEGDRIRFVTQLRTFLATYPGAGIIVTSREAGFRIVGGALSAHCQHYKAADFDKEDITWLTLAWHKEVVGDSPGVREEAEKLAREIHASDRVQRLAENPLLLTTLLLVKRWVGQLPTRRSVLYGKAIEVLLMTWNVKGHDPMDLDEAIPQLAFVAFTMMKDGVQRISSKRLKEILLLARKQMPEILAYARYSASEFIDRVEYRSSLLILSGHEIEQGSLRPMYEFRHLTFQEYLTALAIVEGYYPGRKDEDTLLSILKPHLEAEELKEVTPLAAVLSGRKVQPLIQHLIELCKESEPVSIGDETHPALLLSQCILDEIQLAPRLLEESLEWISRRTSSVSETIRMLHKGKFGNVLEKVVQNAYINSNEDLGGLGSALSEITLEKIGWKDLNDLKPQLIEKIEMLLAHDDPMQRAEGALSIMRIAYQFEKNSNTDPGEILQSFGDKLITLLNSNNHLLHFAACWAFVWLGRSRGWATERYPAILPRLLTLWNNSELPDVQYVSRWALSVLPIIDRKSNPLPAPESSDFRFIKEQYYTDQSLKKEAALVLGFYWKKPWSDDELATLVAKAEWRFNELNRDEILKALGEPGKAQLDALEKMKRPYKY